MQRFLERQRAGRLDIFPLLLRPVDLQNTALANLRSYPCARKGLSRHTFPHFGGADRGPAIKTTSSALILHETEQKYQ